MPSDLNSPIGVLTSWLHDIGLRQVIHLRHIVIPIADECPEQFPENRRDHTHPGLIVIYPGPTGKKFSEARVEILMDSNFVRFYKPAATSTWVLEDGELGREWGTDGESAGCAPFHHALYRFLSAQEPEVHGVRRVATRSPDEDESESKSRPEHSRRSIDWAERECGFDLRQEVVPPTSFHPTTDLFTVLSILEGAFMTHCTCCLKDPLTTAPIRRSRRASYEKPYDKLEKDFSFSDYDSYREAHGALTTSIPGIWRSGEMTSLRCRLRKKSKRREGWRILDALLALDIDYEYAAACSYHGFRTRWKEARREAGDPVAEPKYEPMGDVDSDDSDVLGP